MRVVRHGQGSGCAVLIAAPQGNVLSLPDDLETKCLQRPQHTRLWGLGGELRHGALDDGFRHERFQHRPLLALQRFHPEGLAVKFQG